MNAEQRTAALHPDNDCPRNEPPAVSKARETLIRAALRDVGFDLPAPATETLQARTARVSRFTIGRTWSYPGKYGNAKLEFTIETPPGVDVAEVIENATAAIEDMNPTDSEENAKQWIAQEIDRLRAPDAESRKGELGCFVDDFKAWRAEHLADLEERLADECRKEERRAAGAEQMANLICLAAQGARA
jgi:hypothetical protein